MRIFQHILICSIGLKMIGLLLVFLTLSSDSTHIIQHVSLDCVRCSTESKVLQGFVSVSFETKLFYFDSSWWMEHWKVVTGM